MWSRGCVCCSPPTRLKPTATGVGYESCDPSSAQAAVKPSIRPSADFYAFANGSWIESVTVPPDSPVWSPFAALQHMTHLRVRMLLNELASDAEAVSSSPGPSATAPLESGSAYDPDASQPSPVDAHADQARVKLAIFWRCSLDVAAVEEAGLAPLRPLLDTCEAFFVDKATGLATLHARYGIGAFFSISAGPDDRQSDRCRLRLRPGRLGLPHTSYYVEPEHAEVRQRYVSHVESMLILLGEPAALAAAAADSVLRIETELASARRRRVRSTTPLVTGLVDAFLTCARLCCRWSPEESSSASSHSYQRPYAIRTGISAPEYRRMSARELQRHCGEGLEWDRYLDAVGAAAHEELIVESLAGLIAAVEVLHSSTAAELRAYLIWQAALSCAPHLPRRLADTHFTFYGRFLNGQQARCAPSRC